jgi:hypothetical protein
MNISQLPDGISLIPITDWENRHQNFKVNLTPDASFNMRLPFAFTEHEKNYKATTKNFQWLIQYAIDKGLRLRALGGGWSFSDVAVGDGLVDTRELRTFFSIGDSFLNQAYLDKGNQSSNLILTQCGMSMLQLSRELERENGWMKSLKASGASNGQTVVGATATGTHGAAYDVGAVHDTIVGMHIITGPDKHVWVEKASNPVASEKFITWLGAEKISDDDIFNSAVVSFGSFGFVHSVLLETEPIFLLEKRHKGNIPYDDNLKGAINSLDFKKVEALLPYPLGAPNPPLYHFEIVVNPHNLAENDPDKGVFFRLMYKLPYRENYTKEVENNTYQYGDDLLGIVQTVLDGLGNTIQLLVVPKLVGALLPQAFAADALSQGTIGETFGNTKVRGQAASAAIGIDSSHASLAIDEIVKLNKKIPFAGALALRFVKGTEATLGFTHFPNTCVLEMDGVDSKASRKFFQAFWERLEELDVPYTLHWGKINFILNSERVRKMYGVQKVNKWIDSRETLLDEASRRVFTNDFLVRIGLDKK